MVTCNGCDRLRKRLLKRYNRDLYPEVDRNVSAVAAIPRSVRLWSHSVCRAGENGDVVAEGLKYRGISRRWVGFLDRRPCKLPAHRRAVYARGGDAATGNDAQVDAKNEE